VDLVESGETMRAAHLMKIHTILDSEAVLIQNPHKSHPLIPKICSRIEGVIVANKYVYMNYNILRVNLPEAIRITPGRKAPTISPLEDEAWVGVSAMVEKKQCAEVMDLLSGVGAKDILVFNIQNCRA